VTLLEAGGDPRTMTGGDAIDPATNRLPEDYDVPAFHAFASENSAMKWDFFVRHYADQTRRSWTRIILPIAMACFTRVQRHWADALHTTR